MPTDLIEIDAERPSERAIERAAAAVRRGQVVAIPTDALYSLVCDPLNLHAVGRIFAAKGREQDRALPLLVSDVVMAEELTKEISARFYLLARHFWPGELTIIVHASSRVPLKVTGNTGRLAMRQSKSKVAERVAGAAGTTADRHQREPLRPAHLQQRHRGLRRHGRPCRPGARRRTGHRPGSHHGRHHRAVLAGDQARRDSGELDRGGPEGS